MTQTVKRRGRPPKNVRTHEDTRELLLRSGLELLTEQGFSATGLDKILKRVGVPKGSFYHYFDSKEAFGRAVMSRYGQFFKNKLRQSLKDSSMAPLERLGHFVDVAVSGMEKHDFKRGCLIGNLAQEVSMLPDDFRQQLETILRDWESDVSECLEEALQSGAIDAEINCQHMARIFWIGWEGAVMRARLMCSDEPMRAFYDGYIQLLRLKV